jgi:hypothetical protein
MKSVSQFDEDILKRTDDLITLTGALPDRGTGVVMREDFASSSFLALIVVSLIIVCTGFLALGI